MGSIRIQRIVAGQGLVAGLLLALPCCSSSGGPVRYQLSGKVTVGGQTVPRGHIQFEPDVEKGNSGPGSFAKIDRGRYVTNSENGTIGGPHVARFVLRDGVAIGPDDGMPFPPGHYAMRVDLPSKTAVLDFDIPTPP